MIQAPKFKSTYGMLDVMRGRHKLAAHLQRNGPVKVLIEATLTEPFGSDDGESIEFNMSVTKVNIIH